MDDEQLPLIIPEWLWSDLLKKEGGCRKNGETIFPTTPTPRKKLKSNYRHDILLMCVLKDRGTIWKLFPVRTVRFWLSTLLQANEPVFSIKRGKGGVRKMVKPFFWHPHPSFLRRYLYSDERRWYFQKNIFHSIENLSQKSQTKYWGV